MNTTKSHCLIRNLLLSALMAALMTVCSQIQIPLPYVPINLALFGAHMAGVLLGAKWGGISMTVYAGLAVIGVPVLAGFSGGIGVVLGSTGGYVLGYILCAILDGALIRRWNGGFPLSCAAMTLGALVCYCFGTAWFMVLTGMDLVTSLSFCVIPFLPGDAVKIILASALSVKLRPILVSNGLVDA